jgi:hypothetical protein
VERSSPTGLDKGEERVERSSSTGLEKDEERVERSSPTDLARSITEACQRPGVGIRADGLCVL